MNTSPKPKIAVIGTGGTISSVGANPLELMNYVDNSSIYTAEELVAATPCFTDVTDPVIVPFSAVPSQNIGPDDWLRLATTINAITDEVDGIIVTHGTASLEETAWFLNLTVTTSLPVVIVGAQRPHSGLSTDAHINLLNAALVAASPAARGLGVLVCLNSEIHAAREVTKTSTYRMQTFMAPEFGPLGHVDHDSVNIYRKPLRRHAPNTEFDVSGIKELPRVDIAYSYAGVDGMIVKAMIDAGAKAIVVAGFAPGLTTTAMLDALNEACDRGVIVVQSSRAGSGRVTRFTTKQARDTVTADNLNPQKARILAMLALTRTADREKIQAMFNTY